MEAEERMKRDKHNELLAASQSSVANQFSSKRGSEFSENSSQSVSESDSELPSCLEDPVTADGRTRSSTSCSNTVLEENPLDAIALDVQEKMIQMGMYRETLPTSTAAAKNHIFLSEDWQTCDKVCRKKNSKEHFKKSL